LPWQPKNGCRSRPPWLLFSFFLNLIANFEIFPDVNLCVHTSSRVGGSCCCSFSFHVMMTSIDWLAALLSQFFPCTSPGKKEIPKSLKLEIDYFDFLFWFVNNSVAVVRRKLPNKRRAVQSLLDFLLLLLLGSRQCGLSSPRTSFIIIPRTHRIVWTVVHSWFVIHHFYFSFSVSRWIDLSPHDRTKWNCLTQIQTFEL
jgi:hypothetical protein